ncbi:hypothetical protein [Urechidicola croceus]|uniref:Uncharacterized protein n=1 Tax=Urechidicola croceus TaxID=1850246 RepID=A0A1D8P7P7_9FLAO|nr:hypothetical protein [Urechidicola croceus]AOW20595.1 hypothetical protein LPB138_07850 [Urechidicola croceus]
MNYSSKLPVSDIKLMDNKEFENNLNKTIIKAIENHTKVCNSISYGLKISEYFPHKVLILVYKDIFRLKEGFFSKAVLFKEYFNEFESKSKIGKVKFDWDSEEVKEIDEFNVYNGNFSAYVLIFEKLYFFYFIKELRKKDEFFVSIQNFIGLKTKEVSTNPFNYFLMDRMADLIFEPDFTAMDIKEYVELTLSLISKEIEVSKNRISNEFGKSVDSFFVSDKYEEFFMYLLKVNKNKRNKSFFSTLYRYFVSKEFISENHGKPRHYFSLLKERDIFQFEPLKIIPSSISSEQSIFIEFDKLYTGYLLQKE